MTHKLLQALVIAFTLTLVACNNSQTENVIAACAVLKHEHIDYDIYDINGSPVCVFKIDDQYWYYDGEKGSNVLNFLPTENITSRFIISSSNSMPVNSCLIQALISYNHHKNYKYNRILFTFHHAVNVYH